MIEVFKTNIDDEQAATSILNQLVSLLPQSFINFDLEDCDKILRIQNCEVQIAAIVKILNQNGFECERLE